MKNFKPKRKLILFVSIILSLLILLTLIGPQFVLMAARQPKVEANYSYSENFYNTYDEIRDHLKERVNLLRQSGAAVEVSEYAVDESDDLYINNVYLPAASENQNLIILTTGVHGMEGYIGSVMLDVFFEALPKKH